MAAAHPCKRSGRGVFLEGFYKGMGGLTWDGRGGGACALGGAGGEGSIHTDDTPLAQMCVVSGGWQIRTDYNCIAPHCIASHCIALHTKLALPCIYLSHCELISFDTVAYINIVIAANIVIRYHICCSHE